MVRNADIVRMKFGSHLYGLNTPDSDIDWKGVFLPSLRELLLNDYKRTEESSTGPKEGKNSANDVDEQVISLPYFIELACKGETVALDMLHCKQPELTSGIWEDLVNHRTLFYTKNMASYIGYVKKQAAKYGIKGTRVAAVRAAYDYLRTFDSSPGHIHCTPIGHPIVWEGLPEGEHARKVFQPAERASQHDQWFYEICGKKYQSTWTVETLIPILEKVLKEFGGRAKLAEKNDGVDWKAISHALRASYQARDIYRYGDFEYPLKETPFLLEVKQGQLDFKSEVQPELELVVAQVTRLAEQSRLPESIDRKAWNSWLQVQYVREFNLREANWQ